MKKELKTNAMRILDKLDIDYDHQDYGLEGDFVSSVDLSKKTHQDIQYIYKTLATIANTNDIYIFVIPGEASINFKKAAKCLGVKNLEMLPLKELKSKIGYERGATTALAMKKDYPVLVDIKAKDFDIIKVSAGKIGHGLKLNPDDFIKATKGKYADICQEN